MDLGRPVPCDVSADPEAARSALQPEIDEPSERRLAQRLAKPYGHRRAIDREAVTVDLSRVDPESIL